MYKVYPINLNKHMPYIIQMWKDRNFPILPEECLPNRGYIVFHNDIPICSAFLYTDGISICAWLTWVVINKDCSNEEKSQGFKLMIEKFDELCRDLNIRILYSPTNNKALMKRFELTGFGAYDRDVVDYMKVII